MEKPLFSVVLPCYNEAKNIPLVVERFARWWEKYNFELILVNNGSLDDSARVLQEIQARYPDCVRVVTIEKNQGYGHGIYTGLNATRANIVAYTHADIQTPPEDVIKAYMHFHDLQRHDVLVKGLRINRRPEELLVSRGLEKVVQIILGYSIHDINGQPKIFTRQLLEQFKNPPKDFSFDVYVLYMAKRNNVEIVTFPVDFGLRLHGSSSWASSIRKKYKMIAKCFFSIIIMAVAHYSDKNNIISQGIRFLISGIVVNIVNYLSFLLCLRGLHVYYVTSSVIGFLMGVVVSFIINRHWTFYATHKAHYTQLWKFLIMNMISLGVNVITIRACTEVLDIIPEISQIIAIAVSAVINFIGCKLWVFKKTV